jgi:N-acetylmuramoyl-L-alanine amidase
MANELIGIYLSPSNQTANKYAYGNTNEAVVCRKIANATEAALNRCKVFRVYNNQTDSMEARCRESDKLKVKLHIPIHTNALSDKEVAGTIIFCWDKKGEGYKVSKAIFKYLSIITPGKSAEYIKEDRTLYEVRVPAAPTAYLECGFHSNTEEAKWIIENVEAIGESIAHGICDYCGVEYVPPVVEKYRIVLGEYNTIKEADAALGQIYKLLGDAQQALVTLDANLRKAIITDK